MTIAQLTHAQIGDYVPWTVTAGPRREAYLLALQARLFADLAQAVGRPDGYAFFTRIDNIVAVTDGIGAKTGQ